MKRRSTHSFRFLSIRAERTENLEFFHDSSVGQGTTLILPCNFRRSSHRDRNVNRISNLDMRLIALLSYHDFSPILNHIGTSIYIRTLLSGAATATTSTVSRLTSICTRTKHSVKLIKLLVV